jgi:hypothetical protein
MKGDTMERVVYKTDKPRPEVSDTEYDERTRDWLEVTDSTLYVAFSHTGKYFLDDRGDRDVYDVTLSRGNHDYTFTFGQSLNDSAARHRRAPSAYSILACLEVHNPGTFENFCADYGCDTDSRSAEKTYHAVVGQWLQLSRMYTPEQLDDLAEIQ